MAHDLAPGAPVIAAKRLDADRIIALSRKAARHELVRSFGTTHISAEHGEAATEKFMELIGGAEHRERSREPAWLSWPFRR
jgi:Zn-dependent alcohol dehydrogenase